MFLLSLKIGWVYGFGGYKREEESSNTVLRINAAERAVLVLHCEIIPWKSNGNHCNISRDTFGDGVGNTNYPIAALDYKYHNSNINLVYPHCRLPNQSECRYPLRYNLSCSGHFPHVADILYQLRGHFKLYFIEIEWSYFGTFVVSFELNFQRYGTTGMWYIRVQLNMILQ